MNGPQQPAFFPMAFPMPSAPALRDEPPARIRMAVDFLALLIHKQMSRAAVNDISIEWAEGQKLIGSEIEAQIAACDLLTKYFEGKLRPDVFEKRETEDLGAIIRCPGCFAQGNADGTVCDVCCGRGRVYIKPVGGKRS